MAMFCRFQLFYAAFNMWQNILWTLAALYIAITQISYLDHLIEQTLFKQSVKIHKNQLLYMYPN